jgi:hypothetical protein
MRRRLYLPARTPPRVSCGDRVIYVHTMVVQLANTKLRHTIGGVTELLPSGPLHRQKVSPARLPLKVTRVVRSQPRASRQARELSGRARVAPLKLVA